MFQRHVLKNTFSPATQTCHVSLLASFAQNFLQPLASWEATKFTIMSPNINANLVVRKLSTELFCSKIITKCIWNRKILSARLQIVGKSIILSLICFDMFERFMKRSSENLSLLESNTNLKFNLSFYRTSCELCSSKFVRQDTYKRHIQTHHQELTDGKRKEIILRAKPMQL